MSFESIGIELKVVGEGIVTDPIERQEDVSENPFIILFQDAKRQQMLFDERILPFTELLNISLVNHILRAKFLEHVPWRVRILQEILISRALFTVQRPYFASREQVYETFASVILQHRGLEVVPYFMRIVKTGEGSSYFNEIAKSRPFFIQLARCIIRERTQKAIEKSLDLVNIASSIPYNGAGKDLSSVIGEICYVQAHLNGDSCIDAGLRIINFCKKYQKEGFSNYEMREFDSAILRIIHLSREHYEESVTSQLIEIGGEVRALIYNRTHTLQEIDEIKLKEIDEIKDKINNDQICREIDSEIEVGGEDYLRNCLVKLETLRKSKNYRGYFLDLLYKYNRHATNQSVDVALQIMEVFNIPESMSQKVLLLNEICIYKLKSGGLNSVEFVKGLINRYPKIGEELASITIMGGNSTDNIKMKERYKFSASRLSIIICDTLLKSKWASDEKIIKMTKEFLPLIQEKEMWPIPYMLLYIYGEQNDVTVVLKQFFKSADIEDEVKREIAIYFRDNFIARGAAQACRANELYRLLFGEFHVTTITAKIVDLSTESLSDLRKIVDKTSELMRKFAFTDIACARARGRDPKAIKDAVEIVEWIPQENLLLSEAFGENRCMHSQARALMDIAFYVTDIHIPQVDDLSKYFQACYQMVNNGSSNQTRWSRFKGHFSQG